MRYDMCVHYICECILYIYCGAVIGLARCCSIRSPQTHRKTETTTPATKWLLLLCTFAAVAGVSNTSCTLGPCPPEILAFHGLSSDSPFGRYVPTCCGYLSCCCDSGLDRQFTSGLGWPVKRRMEISGWCLKSVNPECPIDNPLNWYGGYHS